MDVQGRVIIGISGASGAIYGVRMLKMLQSFRGLTTHLVISQAAKMTLKSEMGISPKAVEELASKTYVVTDIGAEIASGSFPTLGMIIAPCSIRTMSEISTGVTSSLLTRAADVHLKERRKLILMVRETPLHVGHLETMTRLSHMGAIIAPPVPAFYNNPSSIEDIVVQTNARMLALLGLEHPNLVEWGGLSHIKEDGLKSI